MYNQTFKILKFVAMYKYQRSTTKKKKLEARVNDYNIYLSHILSK